MPCPVTPIIAGEIPADLNSPLCAASRQNTFRSLPSLLIPPVPGLCAVPVANRAGYQPVISGGGAGQTDGTSHARPVITVPSAGCRRCSGRHSARHPPQSRSARRPGRTGPPAPPPSPPLARRSDLPLLLRPVLSLPLLRHPRLAAVLFQGHSQPPVPGEGH